MNWEKWIDTIEKLYILYFQRPADPEGLFYWSKELEKANGNLDKIIQMFANSDEAKTVYGEINEHNIEMIIKEVYQIAFNREPTQKEIKVLKKDFIENKLPSERIILNILNLAKEEDKKIFKTKIMAAKLFTKELIRLSKISNFKYEGNIAARITRNWLIKIDKHIPSLEEIKSLFNQIQNIYYNPEIKIEIINLWKKFKIYYYKVQTLKERLILRNNQKIKYFWALKNINLKIPKNATVGLIGRNGSGKSTLLKLISKIIYPTKGEIKVNGKISTLLELGAGFHPEFTGLENIFLNGIIMGLSKKQIKEKLDEIISFAELQNFIHTPVKNYSSGMCMRLGFSIAVHYEPDILLIDEVLAVGDISFQKKCLTKIKELQKKGTTIVFVSHSLEQIKELCDWVIWLEKGEIKSEGFPNKVIREYQSFIENLKPNEKL